jgi:hypothetical protein
MTQPQVATVPAAVEAALSAQQVTTAKECGARFFNSKIEAIETPRVYAKEVIGIEPSYDQWEQGRINCATGMLKLIPRIRGTQQTQNGSGSLPCCMTCSELTLLSLRVKTRPQLKTRRA